MNTIKAVIFHPHLSFDGQLDSEGDEVSEELLQPVRPGQRQADTQKQAQAQRSCNADAMQISHLLFVSLQVKAKLVKVQITV